MAERQAFDNFRNAINQEYQDRNNWILAEAQTPAANLPNFGQKPAEGVGSVGGLGKALATLDQETAGPTPEDTRSPQQIACDNHIAKIFGGPGAVAATVAEPTTLLSSNRNRNPGAALDHLANNGVFHLYTNAQGTKETVPLFKLPGGVLSKNSGEYDNKGQTENFRRFNYTSGPWKGVTLSFVHVGGTHGGQKQGQYMGKFPGQPNRIGNIGGLGGEGFGYNHTHVKVFFHGQLTDPRKVFCKQFGF